MDPTVAVVILNYNGRDDTLACLASVYRSNGIALDVIVVDNGSSDGSVTALKAAYPSLIVIENSRNLGFAAGCNQGISKAFERGDEYIVLLNNDTDVPPEALGLLAGHLEKDSAIGAISPMIFYWENRERIWSSGGRIDWARGIWTNKGDRRYLAGQPYEVDALSGCCLMIPATVLRECGLFEEKLFLYGEDIDLCLRIGRSGRKLVVLPAARIWHKVGASVGGSESAAYLYYTQRNRLYFMRTYTRGWRWFVFCAYFLLSMGGRCVRFFLAGQRMKSRAVIKATADSFTGNYGPLPEGGIWS